MSVPITELDLPRLDLFGTEFATDPWRAIARAQRESRFAASDLGYLLLTYHGTNAVLRDQRFSFASELGLDEVGSARERILARAQHSLLHMHGPEHTRLRKLVSPAFTPRAARQWDKYARQIIDGLLDEVAPTGSCEFTHQVAEQYPVMVICAILGTPTSDWRFFSQWATRTFRRIQFQLTPEVADDIVAAQQEMDDYLTDLVRRRHDALSDDLVSNLIRAEESGDKLTEDEVVSLIEAVLSAGIDTTRNQLATGIYLLATHPEQLAAVIDDPGLLPGAVEEIVRYRPAVAGTIRTSTEDVELDDGVLVPAGTVLVPSMAAANRDPAVYPEPDRFDVTRTHGSPVLSFGGGVHYCLGAGLARVELREALAAITGRLRGLRVVGDTPWKSLVGISGPQRLTIAFDAAR